jgi:hypothetical protein
MLWVGIALAGAAENLDRERNLTEQVLARYVVEGRVDYAGLQANPKALLQYLQEAGAVEESEFKSWSKNRQLAFLVNLYNTSTLQLIVAHYPISSIKKTRTLFKGPWDQLVVTFQGKKITLNELEHGIIRKRYTDPRIHMALVCAAKGCPILRSEAYTADRLDEQFADQSRRYLATSAGLVIDHQKGTASISSIFKWYGEDFSSVPAFIEKYSDENIDGLKIRYLNYDWSLNVQ